MNPIFYAPEREPTPPPRRAAFFDLDRTLIPGSSLFLLARGLHQRDFVGTGDLLGFVWRQLAYRVSGTETAGAIRASRVAALEFVRGRERSELEDLAREICDERIVPRVYPEMTDLIEGHRGAGDLTFVTTAAPAELAGILAETLGMSGGLGTRAEVDDSERYSGRLLGPALHGPAKASAVEELAETSGIDLAASVAYSDSINDLPLLELVGNVGVVNPDQRLRAVARDRGWPVHEPRARARRRGRADAGPVPKNASAASVLDRVAELRLSSGLIPEPAEGNRMARYSVEDPAALVAELDAHERFRRDTRLGAVFHPGKTSFREVSRTDSLHITVGPGQRVAAHVDRHSPLAHNQPDSLCRYSLRQTVLHNLSGMASDLLRLLSGRQRGWGQGPLNHRDPLRLAPAHEAVGPVQHGRQPVLEADQIDQVDGQPHHPGGEPGEP